MFGKQVMEKKFYSYYILCFIRVILSLIPQTGYIHPDEHFQGPEIVYGDIFNLEVYRSWEFTDEKPIRSIVFPYFVTGLPSLIAKFLGIQNLLGTFLFPYIMVVMPRIIMCLLSFLNDILIYRICILMKKNYKVPLLFFSSSYITIIYLTRTFSNCLEVLFFSHMIYILCKLLFIQNQLKNSERSCYATFIKLNFMFGLTLAVGVFNRPTFICFAIFPTLTFFFLLLQVERKFKTQISCLISFCIGIFCITLSFIAIDSFYYNRAHYSLIYNPQLYVTVTPLNFILYNIDKENLHSHGLHPHWLHTCVNIPLLFSLYGILVMLSFLKYLCSIRKQNLFSYESVLLLSFVTPLLILSLIPHQEPRFILPLLFPLALLLYSSNFYKFIKKDILIYIWIFHNILGILFFGFLHQGGIYLSSSYIHSSVQKHANCAIIFYKTYMPPRYILGLTENQKHIGVYDFAGINEEGLQLQLKNLMHQFKPNYIYAVVPHEMKSLFHNLSVFQLNHTILSEEYMFPHVSTENLPKLSQLMNIVRSNLSFCHKIDKIKRLLSINLLIFKANV